MAFELHLSISESNPEGRAVEAIASRDHVSLEEAARQLLREVSLRSTSPAEEMWGAFSSPEDSAILDEAMGHVRAARKTEQLRDFGE